MSDLKEFLKTKLQDKYNNNIQNISEEERRANFEKWIGKSEIREVVYHGSVHDFESFDLEKSHYGSYIGKGFYFSTTTADVNANYANVEGVDLKSKIDFINDEANNLIHSYESDKDDEENYIYKLLNNPEFNISPSEFEQLNEDEQAEIIKKHLMKEQLGKLEEDFTPAIYPAHIKTENPFYANNMEFLEDSSPVDELASLIVEEPDIKQYMEENEIEDYEFRDVITEAIHNHVSMYYGEGDDIVFDSNVSLAEVADYSNLAEDEDSQEYVSDMVEKAFKTIIEEKYNNSFRYADEQQGLYVDITNELIKLLKENDIDIPDEMNSAKEELLNHVGPLNYQSYANILRSNYVGDALFGNAELLHGVNNDKSVEIGDLLRQCIQRLGYDGFIMDAGEQFANMKGVYKGDTMHYIVFESNQVKSAIGNNGMFNPEDPRFAFKIESHNAEQNILKINKWEEKTSKIIKLFEDKYPSIKGQISVYKDIKDVPQHLKEESEKVDGLASGIFDRKNNNTAIFLFNIKNEKHLESVIAHEVIGHLGIKNVLGGAYDDYLISAYNFYDKKNELKELKHKYCKAFTTDGHNYNYKKMIAEEKIAETIEKYGVKQIPFYKTIIGNIKNRIRQVFPSLDIPITNNDINYLISRSYSHFKKDKQENKIEKKKFKM
jgi:hypothetical protein